MQTVDLDIRCYRPSVLSDSEAFAQTVLVAPRVSGPAEEVGGAMIVLVIDVSTSMSWEGKLNQAKQAAHVIVDGLRPQDRIAIVAFHNDPRVVVPITSAASASSVKGSIDELSTGGGTEMGKAMTMARSLLSESGVAAARRMVILTDGATSDEDLCRREAQSAANESHPISTYGIGSDWNTELLAYIAELTRGRARFIQNASDVSSDLIGEFKDLQATALADAQLVLVPSDGVELRSVQRVIPDVIPYPITSGPTVTVPVGDISRGTTSAPKFLLDLVLPSRPPGQVRIAKVSMRFRDVGSAERRETEPMNVVVTYTPDRGAASMVDPEIKTLIDQRTAADLVVKAEEDLRNGNTSRATVRLQSARTVTQRLGQAQVTTRLDAAIEEVARSGSLSEEQQKTIRFGTSQTTKLGE